MSGKSKIIKWHPMSEIMAKNIAGNTATPGVWYPIAPSDLPGGIPQMPGIVTAHVSHYLTTTTCR